MFFLRFFFLSFLYFSTNTQLQAVEIRAVISDSKTICSALINEQAQYKGDYAFTDYIYCDCNSGKSLNSEFVRIRYYQKTGWKQKSVVIVHKVRNPQEKNHRILFQKEFDTLTEAQQYVPLGYSKRCSFFRRGWEYLLKDMHIFVEEIEGLPASIEIVAPSQEELFNLFNTLEIVDYLTDSAPEWYCKFNNTVSN